MNKNYSILLLSQLFVFSSFSISLISAYLLFSLLFPLFSHLPSLVLHIFWYQRTFHSSDLPCLQKLSRSKKNPTAVKTSFFFPSFFQHFKVQNQAHEPSLMRHQHHHLSPTEDTPDHGAQKIVTFLTLQFNS